MQTGIVNITEVFEGTRLREDYGDIEALSESIKNHGVIQPLAVMTSGDDTDLPYTLLAGGRRYRACQLAEVETIPVRIYEEELTELELRVIELEENVQRKDLDWMESVRMKQEINNLQMLIHGEKTSTKKDAPGWSASDTARMVGKSHSSISQDLKLAKAIEEFPEVEWDKCKNKNEAQKRLNKLEEGLARRELSRRIENETKNSKNGSYKRQLIDAYMIDDCRSVMSRIDDGVFSLVEIDPPYAIDLEKVKRDYDYKGYNEREGSTYIKFMRQILKESYRIMAPNSWLVFWFAPEPWFESIYTAITETGFSCSRLCGIWTKPTGQSMQPNTHMANAYEMFFYARKGDAVLGKPGRTNIFNHTPVAPQRKYHPTQRPIELMQDIVETFSFEGNQVFVPFAGSGVSLLAAASKNRKPLGSDMSEEFKPNYTVQVEGMF
jgi:ParB/RepB/Spo0J family partition protein